MTITDNTVLFAKVTEDAKIPTKRVEDAGYDIYASFKEEEMIIMPHETRMIPTGIKSAFSSDYVAVLKERGSTGTKGIGQRCGVIDSGFRGQWLVPLTNHNDKPLVITKKKEAINSGATKDLILYPYTKAIAQILFLPVPVMDTQDVDEDTINSVESERGNGKLGSSNK